MILTAYIVGMHNDVTNEMVSGGRSTETGCGTIRVTVHIIFADTNRAPDVWCVEFNLYN